MLSIGQMARRSGVKVPTIRYYEQVGLMTVPTRTQGNQRRYSKVDFEQLNFIKHARDLGLSINATRELIELSRKPNQSCAKVNRIAVNHLNTVRDKIKRLLRLEHELERIALGCDNGIVQDCYVLRSLIDHRLCADEH